MTLEVVAGLAGISAGFLSQVERGLAPLERLSHWRGVANALGVPLSDLLRLELPAPGNGGTDSAIEAVRDATAYAEWSGKRLPTEFEWEYAARGEWFKWWPWGNEWDRRRAVTAEYWSHREMAGLNSWRSWWVEYLRQFGPVPGTAPVGSLGSEATSHFGIHDMAGNVLEWTSSRYKLYADDREYDEIYRFIEGRYLVLRGGSWMNLRYQVRCAERIPTDGAGYSTFAVGFRCAQDA